MLLGSAVGALLKFVQTGLQIIATTFQSWFAVGRTILGFGGGFSATLMGAVYLIDFNVTLSIFIGAVISWLLGVPLLAYFTNSELTQVAHQ